MVKEKISKSLMGKRSRAAGARFELKVRAELEEKGWTVTKWMNNVDFEKDKLIPAKRKYNPFMKALSIGTGFPDFVAFRRKGKVYEVMGVEVKAKGYLDPEERKRCKWILEKNIFSKILIAKKPKERGKVEYMDFVDRYDK
jgi:hypothetical protein|tara:strand:+ start:422 stop:844 length:423 start_codon:yes stop_codon:yes gene_type:complete